MKCRKKPIVVEATEWLMNGDHVVCTGDYIITGVQGEHYPCKPDIFKLTYELCPPTEQ